MQIFIIDYDPKQAARWLCDTHVNKLLIEAGQLLCGAYILTEGKPAPYKLTHRNHPCAIWVRESLDNYIWLLEHAKELCVEYTARRNKHHATEPTIEWLSANIPTKLKSKGLTPFALAIPDEYKRKDAVESYRLFYNEEKNQEKHGRLGTWIRNKPDWFTK